MVGYKREYMTSTTVPSDSARYHNETNHCTDVLADTLRGYQGIEEVEFNVDTGQLKAIYDPRILTNEMALQVIRQAGQAVVTRATQCAAKKEYGLSVCANCTAALEQQLVSQFHTAATLPTASFNNGVIKACLTQPTLLKTNTTAIVSTFPGKASNPENESSPIENHHEVIFTLVNAAAGLTAWLGAQAGWNPMVVGILYIMSYTAGSYFGVRESLEALKEKTINVDMLMLIAAIGAAIVGSPAEGAMLLFLFSISNTLQSFAMDRSRKAIEKLLDLRPSTATVRQGSRLTTIPIEHLSLGDIVIVRPGERFPIDGEVINGETDANQAVITGESMPIHKGPGDQVFASTMNGTGSVEFRVTRLTKDTTLARIVQMVEDAQSSKATTQHVLEKVESFYAIFVLGASVLLLAIPWLVLGGDFQTAFYRAMTWLVVASPCALVISTPASILSAIANAARNGVLFKGGVHLEKTARLKVVAFDKTGTLTSGEPTLTEIFVYANNMDQNYLLRLAGALESRSEHPLARSITKAAHNRG